MFEVTFAPPSREVAKPIVQLIQLSKNAASVAPFNALSAHRTER
jgi:hypothetical protein